MTEDFIRLFACIQLKLRVACRSTAVLVLKKGGFAGKAQRIRYGVKTSKLLILGVRSNAR